MEVLSSLSTCPPLSSVAACSVNTATVEGGMHLEVIIYSVL